ncbi:malate dehydrogenase (acceptor) [compost metagenome]
MLNLIERCFAEQARSEQWASKLKEIFPAREKVLESDAALYRDISARSDAALGLTNVDTVTQSIA